MHGPYRARVSGEGFSFHLESFDVEKGAEIADRFYSSGGGIGVLSGFTRAAVFAVGSILTPGESVEVEIVGRDGTEGSSRPCQASAYSGDHRYCSRCGGTGRETARDVVARTERVRRDDRGRLLSTLGSRFNERVFRGV